MSRVARSIAIAISASALTVLVIAACGPDKSKNGGAVPPPLPPGYDDLRVLSRDDCVALRDHQIEINVAAAMEADGGSSADVGARLMLEAELRKLRKAESEAWVKRCSGRTVLASVLRCMRDSTTPEAFNACDMDNNDGGAEISSPEASTAETSEAG